MKDKIDFEVGVSIGKSNERVLFIAIVLQALLDATKPKKNSESSTAIHARERATAWFFAETGVTCENFNYVCEMANLDPSYTRSFAYKVIKSKEVIYIRKKINALLKG